MIEGIAYKGKFQKFDEIVSKKDLEIENNLNQEIQNRTNADTVLEEKITEETTTRTEKDAELKGLIDTEIANREAADTEINNTIGDINTLKTESKDSVVNSINSIQRHKIVSEAEYNQMVQDGTIDNDIVYEITAEDILPVADNQFSELFNKIYPVGSIYLSMNDTFNPNTAFGGVWEKIQTGRYLQATDNGAGNLINESLPNITGEINTNGQFGSDIATSASGCVSLSDKMNWRTQTQTSTSGGGSMIHINASKSSNVYQDNAKVQPDSIKVIMWRRIN